MASHFPHQQGKLAERAYCSRPHHRSNNLVANALFARRAATEPTSSTSTSFRSPQSLEQPLDKCRSCVHLPSSYNLPALTPLSPHFQKQRPNPARSSSTPPTTQSTSSAQLPLSSVLTCASTDPGRAIQAGTRTKSSFVADCSTTIMAGGPLRLLALLAWAARLRGEEKTTEAM
jgi:hypothetical protein